MNAPEEALESAGYPARFQFYEDLFTWILGPVKTLLSTETWQTGDYGAYGMTMFDEGTAENGGKRCSPGTAKGPLKWASPF